MLIIEHVRMDIKLLEIKNKTNYECDDLFYINDFDVNSLKITEKKMKN